ncbi:MAG TPA: 50S ribosomal protein L11 methyltransferase, partial [Pyrinomonadaceae bacterium]|nr:50S ribosomal protein L11 methyltransferase [Pyrinomonadaceae bacterium]
DFVCANLTIDVILPMIDLLLAKTKRVLLLSGILGTQTDMITEALETRAVERYSINSAGEWISVTVKRN